MSQSPSNSQSQESVTRYRQGWNALNRLLHDDRSFSGHEKNCAFLNMRDGRFASVSSVSGLDFADDSRAIAACDWDFDGRTDLWTTARTAPRLRFVRNQGGAVGNFVAIQLAGNGTDTNADAVGARVEVIVGGASRNLRLVKSLHAGDAFLSQSSYWLHFGLDGETTIEKIIVQWPTQKGSPHQTQVINGCEINRFYRIRQGEPIAALWQPPPNRIRLESSTPQLPAEIEQARIVLLTRLPLPAVKLLASGEPALAALPDTTIPKSPSAALALTGPLLVNIWSTTCAPCLAELEEWAQAKAAFEQHGLEILALNADAGSAEFDAEQVATLTRQLGFSQRSAVADPDSIRAIDYFQRAMLDRWQPLPVPCSFLLDRRGNVAVIYKGRVTMEQLWQDLTLLEADSESLRRAATPFAGQWRNRVNAIEPTSVSSQMIDHNAVPSAIDYLGRFIDTQRQAATFDRTKLSDVLYVRAILLESQRRAPEAIEELREAAQLNPQDLRCHSDLARLFEAAGNLAAAQTAWTAAYQLNRQHLGVQQGLALNLLRQEKYVPAVKLLESMRNLYPDDAMVHFRLATAYGNLHKSREAIASYRRTLELQPNQLLAANNLAWLLATHPDESLRDGAQAVELAERVCQATRHQEPQFLDTLAVAYAEAGDFAKAIATTHQALTLFQASGRSTPAIEKPLQERIQQFSTQQPFREVTR